MDNTSQRPRGFYWDIMFYSRRLGGGGGQMEGWEGVWGILCEWDGWSQFSCVCVCVCGRRTSRNRNHRQLPTKSVKRNVPQLRPNTSQLSAASTEFVEFQLWVADLCKYGTWLGRWSSLITIAKLKYESLHRLNSVQRHFKMDVPRYRPRPCGSNIPVAVFRCWLKSSADKNINDIFLSFNVCTVSVSHVL